MAKKPVLLCIMDGFGWVPEETSATPWSPPRSPISML